MACPPPKFRAEATKRETLRDHGDFRRQQELQKDAKIWALRYEENLSVPVIRQRHSLSEAGVYKVLDRERARRIEAGLPVPPLTRAERNRVSAKQATEAGYFEVPVLEPEFDEPGIPANPLGVERRGDFTVTALSWDEL